MIICISGFCCNLEEIGVDGIGEEGSGEEGRGVEGRGVDGRGERGIGVDGRGERGRGEEGRGADGRDVEGRGLVLIGVEGIGALGMELDGSEEDTDAESANAAGWLKVKIPIVNKAADFVLNLCIAFPSLFPTELPSLRSEMRVAECFSTTESLRAVWQFCPNDLSVHKEDLPLITLVENPAV